MQDPNEDTEWNDVLRSHGIIPPKEIREEDIIKIADEKIEQYISRMENQTNPSELTQSKVENFTLEQLDEHEDDIEEDFLQNLRKKRLQEMMERNRKNIFGSVIQITAVDYVDQVNKAGADVYVVLHLYKNEIEVCKFINNSMEILAKKFAHVKFVKSISTDCIENYPDKNTPTIFIYKDSQLVSMSVGAHNFPHTSANPFSPKDLEWMLSQNKIVETEMTKNPRLEKNSKKSAISASIFGYNKYNDGRSSDDGDDDDY